MSAPDASSRAADTCQLENTYSFDQSSGGEVSCCRATDLGRRSSTGWSRLNTLRLPGSTRSVLAVPSLIETPDGAACARSRCRFMVSSMGLRQAGIGKGGTTSFH